MYERATSNAQLMIFFVVLQIQENDPKDGLQILMEEDYEYFYAVFDLEVEAAGEVVARIESTNEDSFL